MSVTIQKENGKTLKKTFEKIFKDFGDTPKGNVFIKPNFSGRPPLIPGENTDPIFLKELTEFLLNAGVKQILIGHGALLGTQDKHFPFDEIIEKGGFAFLREMPKVRLVDLDKNKKELVESRGFKFLLPKILKEIHINLAKLKMHMETTVSLSIKNQMGLVAPGDRVNMHHTKLEESIAILATLVKPNLNIVDGIVAMEGNGPHHGKGKVLNLVAAATDMVELDSVVCNIVGIDFKKVKHISFAESFGVGKFPTEDELKKFEKYKVSDFLPAAKFEKFGNINAWPTTACSRCITAINESGKLMKKHPIKHLGIITKVFIGKKKYNVVIGRAEGLELPKGEKVICIGTCAKDFADKNCVKCLNKCPPSIKETLEWLEREVD
jgi:uncharacterized protein (DUF362 family)